ncbi:hypothetical protein ACEN2J_15855 [Pseudorhodobacter sp. W20_MBD10_FR17]|uniref:hypothetical protein n=1 Tax=Pseudorhodobacter sp. W20_MBD10_FR17 TaxID=3240266 RepID=UPI003F964450
MAWMFRLMVSFSALIQMRYLSLCAAIFGTLLGLVVTADAAKADAADRAQIAGIAGTDRLRMFTYGKFLETGVAPRSVVGRMKKLMVGQGFYYAPGESHVIAAEAWAAPVLNYDSNINGGVLNDSFTFNGFVFDADPTVRAKAGVVMGVAAGGLSRLAWSSGRYIEMQLRAESVWSPDYNIGRSTAALSLCSRNHVKAWTFLDLCHSATGSDRALGSSVSRETALSATQLFQTGAGYHEMTAEVAQLQDEAGFQPAVTLSWGAIWDRAATKLSLTKAAPKAGEIALNSRIAADAQWLMGGHAVGVGLWHQRFTGGAFLGTARSDAATGISLSYQPRAGLTVQLGYMENRSNIDLFDVSQSSLQVRFDAVHW